MRRRIAAFTLVVAVSPLLAGCFNGQGATTTTQAGMNSGNGTDAVAGELHVENATLVLGPEGSGSATLLARIVNTGPVADRLMSASVADAPAAITGDTVAIEPGASVSFGYDSQTWINSYALDAPAATYVPVQLVFERAGIVPLSILIVPPVGYYDGIAPNPPTAS